MNVIIIDSNPTYLKLWERILNNIGGCSYNISNNPKDAISLIKKHNFDLIISEIVFPEHDGYEIAQIAHESHPNAQILLTTAYECDLTRFNIQNPKFSVLYKPYNNIDAIQSFIEHLLRHEDFTSDASEDSFSENESFPEVLEWKL